MSQKPIRAHFVKAGEAILEFTLIPVDGGYRIDTQELTVRRAPRNSIFRTLEHEAWKLFDDLVLESMKKGEWQSSPLDLGPGMNM